MEWEPTSILMVTNTLESGKRINKKGEVYIITDKMGVSSKVSGKQDRCMAKGS